MATTESEHLNLVLEDDDEPVSIVPTAENFEKLDDFAGDVLTDLAALETPTPTAEQELTQIEDGDGHLTLWGKVKKLVSDFLAHTGAGGGAHAAATTASAGFMSAADKAKLDGIEAGATAGGGSGGNYDGALTVANQSGVLSIATGSAWTDVLRASGIVPGTYLVLASVSILASSGTLDTQDVRVQCYDGNSTIVATDSGYNGAGSIVLACSGLIEVESAGTFTLQAKASGVVKSAMSGVLQILKLS